MLHLAHFPFLACFAFRAVWDPQLQPLAHGCHQASLGQLLSSHLYYIHISPTLACLASYLSGNPSFSLG